MKVTVKSVVTGLLGTIPQRLGKETGRLRNQRTSQNHPDYSIIKIDQNTEKSPRDLRRLAVTQTSVRNHQLMLV